MPRWFYSANMKFYDVFSAFKERGVVWHIDTKIEVGDTVYIYLSSPYIKNSVNDKSTDKARYYFDASQAVLLAIRHQKEVGYQSR